MNLWFWTHDPLFPLPFLSSILSTTLTGLVKMIRKICVPRWRTETVGNPSPHLGALPGSSSCPACGAQALKCATCTEADVYKLPTLLALRVSLFSGPPVSNKRPSLQDLWAPLASSVGQSSPGSVTKKMRLPLPPLHREGRLHFRDKPPGFVIPLLPSGRDQFPGECGQDIRAPFLQPGLIYRAEALDQEYWLLWSPLPEHNCHAKVPCWGGARKCQGLPCSLGRSAPEKKQSHCAYPHPHHSGLGIWPNRRSRRQKQS